MCLPSSVEFTYGEKTTALPIADPAGALAAAVEALGVTAPAENHLAVPSILEVDGAALDHDVGLWADRHSGSFSPLTLVAIPRQGLVNNEPPERWALARIRLPNPRRTALVTWGRRSLGRSPQRHFLNVHASPLHLSGRSWPTLSRGRTRTCQLTFS
jgi:hypothetical protein